MPEDAIVAIEELDVVSDAVFIVRPPTEKFAVRDTLDHQAGQNRKPSCYGSRLRRKY